MSTLTEEELENMKNYRYVSAGYSIIDNKMDPYWKFMASLVPHKISPNMLTLMGLFCLWTPVPIILYFDFSLEKQIPYWLYFYMAFTVFLGQTFDAIDGKHARNTNRCSPLGQVMDHGCDSIASSFSIIMIGQAMQLGSGFTLVILQVYVQFTFYVFTWEEYMTGTLSTHYNNFGVTETQFIEMLILLLPTLDFIGLIHLQIYNDIEVVHIMVFITFLISLWLSTGAMINIIKKTESEKFYKGSLMLISPLIFFIAEFYLIPTQVFKDYTVFVVLLNGLVFGGLSIKLIICSMTKNKNPEIINFEILVYLLLIIVLNFVPVSQQIFMMVVVGLIYGIRFFSFVYHFINKCLDYLNINF